MDERDSGKVPTHVQPARSEAERTLRNVLFVAAVHGGVPVDPVAIAAHAAALAAGRPRRQSREAAPNGR